MSDYAKTGYLKLEDLDNFLPKESTIKGRNVAVIECVQEIPCNPCVTACPAGAISMEDINAIPKVNFNKCTGCGKCVAVCPGLAIFLMKITESGGEVTLPYEMLPTPSKDSIVYLLNREGRKIGKGRVTKVFKFEKEVNSVVVTVAFDESALVFEVRNIEVIENE